ncbi:MAG: hypothetical protein K2I74_01925 [Treponemataceae bacterium]|nr:hypothetical protein [Treponemataceae bacterium]
MDKHVEILDEAYDTAVKHESAGETVPHAIKEQVRLIVSRSEDNKGIIAVLMTLLSHKLVDPSQDIRRHQKQIEGGFSGRTIDKDFITPWIKEHSFPAMAESGWLTRSLEQAVPYDAHYTGKIRPQEVKDAFLNIIGFVEAKNGDARAVLAYFVAELIKKRDAAAIDLAKPHSLSISKIVQVLEAHFTARYSCAGASRLPVLAVYAAYECMMREVERFKDKTLLPMEAHNSADTQSGRIGDIDIWRGDSAFEGVEVKHEIKITRELVGHAYEKFKVHPTDRYYLLTTANMDGADWDSINAEIEKIANIHGCQVIVNGVYSSIKYYLRMIRNPADFIDRYVELLKSDRTVKFAHKEKWNEIVARGIAQET